MHCSAHRGGARRRVAHERSRRRRSASGGRAGRAGATEKALDAARRSAERWQALCAAGSRHGAGFHAHPRRDPSAGTRQAGARGPWRQPASPAEELWFRGLIFRGFADVGDGPLEYFYIPAELLSLCGEPEQAAVATPAPTPANVFDHANAPPASEAFSLTLAGGALAIDACQTLAALRAMPPA